MSLKTLAEKVANQDWDETADENTEVKNDSDNEEEEYNEFVDEIVKPTQKSKKIKKLIEAVAFAAIIALAIPFSLPLLLKGFDKLLNSELSASIYNVSKSWILITQTVSLFIAVRFSKIKAYIFIMSVPVGLFLLELIVLLLNLIPIW